MSGETEEDVSGWTVDTLRVHIERQLELLHAEIDRRLARVELISTEHTATLRAEFQASFVAAEKAVDAALASQEKAVAAAMAASDKQIDRADAANEKRFDSVNEFRSQQADLIARFMPRAEALAIIDSTTARILALTEAGDRRYEDMAKLIDKLDKRMDLREGQHVGQTAQEQSSAQQAAATTTAANALRVQLIMTGSVIVAAIGLAVTIILALNN